MAGVFAQINANKKKPKVQKQPVRELQDDIIKEIEENDGDEDLTYQDDNLILDDFDALKAAFQFAYIVI